MISKDSEHADIVDLERGPISEENDRSGPRISNNFVIRVSNGVSAEEQVTGSPERDETQDLGREEGNLDLAEKRTDSEKKRKKKAGRKPPKPPRPPRAVSIDIADQKVLHQISELAMMKRARIERMKALLKVKNSRPSFLASNFWPLLISILFCVIIVWQGFCSRTHPRSSFAGSPESSVGNGRMIQVQFLRNAFPGESYVPSSASPSVMESSMNGE